MIFTGRGSGRSTLYCPPLIVLYFMHLLLFISGIATLRLKCTIIYHASYCSTIHRSDLRMKALDTISLWPFVRLLIFAGLCWLSGAAHINSSFGALRPHHRSVLDRGLPLIQLTSRRIVRLAMSANGPRISGHYPERRKGTILKTSQDGGRDGATSVHRARESG